MEKNKKITDNFYFQIITVALAAYASAFAMLPRVGKWSSVPFCLICGIIAGMVKLNRLYTAGIFAVTTYFMVSFSVGEFDAAITSTVFAALTAIFGCLAVTLFKKRRTAYIACGAVIILALGAAHFMIFGNPAKAFTASDMLVEYTSSRYDDSVTVGSMRYDRKKGMFFCDVNGCNAVTEKRSVYCNGEMIFDNYKKFAELSVMADARQKLQNTLREAFPNGSFKVVPVSSGVHDGDKISVFSQLEDISCMSFDVNVTTALTTEAFTALAVDYIKALAEKGLTPATLRIRGGDVGKYFLTVRTLPVDFPATVHVEYEPDDVFAKYTIQKWRNH